MNSRKVVLITGTSSGLGLRTAIWLRMAAVFFAPTMKAQSSHDTPVGRWQTISDVTGKPNGAVEILDSAGELAGRLIAGRDPVEFETRLCDKCPGDRHNKPMKGLVILSGVRRDGDEWGGGEILDPDIGRVYRVKLKLADAGKKLLVRGYLGVSLFGRTQTWIRME